MGMVVRTNTMALNAYRQLGMNNSAVAKSLEKLSSGYRINRAGDDAAGLAISEKMKAQITGLETASANAQDGISLIQTAEGNLNEVHDMLNRMVELATKSANGTYTSTERQALQSEVDQLLDEVDRISQSANFNGAKLLDGSLDGAGKVTGNTSTIQGLNNFAKYVNRFNNENQGVTDGIDFGKQATVHKDPTGNSRTSFEFDFNARDIRATSTGTLTLQFGLTGEAKAGSGTEYELLKDGNLADGVTPVKGQMDVTFAVSEGQVITGEQIAQKIAETMTGGTGIAKLNIGGKDDGTAIEYKVTAQGNKLKFEMTDAGYQAASSHAKANGGTDLSRFAGNFRGALGIKTDAGLATADKVNLGACSTSVINVGRPDAGGQMAETIVTVSGDKIKDGAGIMVGEEYYVWGGSDSTVNASYGDHVHVVDVRDLMQNGELRTDVDDKLSVNMVTDALSRLSEAAEDNSMFIVQVNPGGGDIIITEKETNPSNIDLTTEENVKNQLKYFTSGIKTIGGNGKALTLQIGDTADEFNKMKVNIVNMSSKGLGINGLDITTEDKASASISRIKTAINDVSSARASMGALQNRLEHTINNLDVAAENLSSANSRIRDTDMAKEMMNYTKMNVLVQSAQAMLAQANQQPQSVLQLLQ